MGSCPSKGLRCGEIVDMDPTVNAIVQAANQASAVAGVPVGEVYVGVAGEHVVGQNARAVVAVRHSARGIDARDRLRAIEKAERSVTVPEDKVVLHSIIQEFRVDGGNPTTNPIGLSGSNLEVSLHVVTVSGNPLHNIIRCVRRAGLRRPDIVLQSLASSMSVSTATEQELGTMLVDIGGGTTDVAIALGGAIRSTADLGIGGDHVTRDIARLLCCSLNDAENAKKRYGNAVPQRIERGRAFSLPSAGDLQEIMTHDEYNLAEIIEARLEEVFEELRQYLDRSGYRDQVHAGTILTGGCSLLPGIADVAERILETKCRRGLPKGLKGLAPVVENPIYSTGIGLILYGMESEKQTYHRKDSPSSFGGIGGVRRLLDYLVETFI